jgi:imidazolonepropionase-like amidohydrolase
MPLIVANNNTSSAQSGQVTLVSSNNQPVAVSSTDTHNVLVVDGKVKKVGKRSQYLIDMMTTEE